MKKNSGFLDRMIERMDQLDPSSIQNYILKLVRENGSLEAIFNTIHEGIFVIDRKRCIEYTNNAGRIMLGMADDVIGDRLDRYLQAVDWSSIMDADPEHWQRISRQEIEIFYPEHRYLSFYVVPVVWDAHSEIPSVTIILHDVTQAKNIAGQQLESQKIQAITMLAAGVAHEIGNPLNSLNIHLQLLSRVLNRSEDTILKEETEELLAVAQSEITRLDSIVSNFLQAVRPAPLELKRILVPKVLAEALAFMNIELQNKDITFKVDATERLPYIMGDESQLKQVFYNIIKNAIQAMPEGGEIAIKCKDTNNFLEVSFTDTGAGISIDNLSKIMNPYYSTKSDGNGLGLLIVDRIIRSHGGELCIASEDGKGAVFTIRLPLQERRIRLLPDLENSVIDIK